MREHSERSKTEDSQYFLSKPSRYISSGHGTHFDVQKSSKKLLLSPLENL